MFKAVIYIVFLLYCVVGVTMLTNAADSPSGTVEAQKAVADAKAQVFGYSGKNDGRYNNIRAENLILETGGTITYFEYNGDRCYVTYAGGISCVGRGR